MFHGKLRQMDSPFDDLSPKIPRTPQVLYNLHVHVYLFAYVHVYLFAFIHVCTLYLYTYMYLHYTILQLTRPGIGRNASYEMDDFIFHTLKICTSVMAYIFAVRSYM